MKTLYSTLAILAITATGAFAAEGDEWLLNSYATETADSATTNTTYGYQTFSNKASAATCNVTGGSVNLVITKYASDGTEGYSANIGLLHPLTPDWSEHDLTGLTSITFEYQNNTTISTEGLTVSFGSSAYSDAISEAGTVFGYDLTSTSALKGSETWKEAEIEVGDIVTPRWWKDIPDDFPDLDTVLKHVKNLQFAPKTTYTGEGSQNGESCTKCVTPTMTDLTLKIRNIVLHGVKNKPWPNPTKIGCEDDASFTVLSQFESSEDDETGKMNAFGGYFFSFSDTGSTGDALGSSAVTDSVYTESGYLTMSASLNKNVGTTYHKYAGWADIGTDFKDKASLNATGLTAIGFTLADLGTNADRIQSIIFKVKMKGVSDTALHQVELAMADIAAGAEEGKFACIRPSDLAQASYIETAHKKAFSPAEIQQLSWEAKITDDRTPSIDTATANLILASVILYGSDFKLNDDPTGVKSQVRVKKTSVSYAHGSLQLSGFTGATHFEVRNLKGKVVSSFAASNRVSLALPRGTYLLSATGDKVHYSSKFAILDR
jgi:hypothetical protein